jgi:hypothetical protein
MFACVELVLSPTVARGKGEEDRTAFRSRRLYSPQCKQVLDPELGPGPKQAERHGAGSGLKLSRQRALSFPLTSRASR